MKIKYLPGFSVAVFLGVALFLSPHVLLAQTYPLDAIPACPINSSTFPYEVIDLGAVTANGLNDSCQVVGSTASGTAFIYSNGAFNDITDGEAYAINNSGQTVGVNGTGDAFMYSSGTIQNLGAGVALGINNLGQAVGQVGDSAVEYVGSSTVSLGLGKATGINDSDQIVGLDPGGDTNYLTPTTTIRVFNGTDIGADLTAAINNKGDVAGTTFFTSNRALSAALYSGGGATEIGLYMNADDVMEGEGFDLNDSDEVVGWADTASGGSDAFLYSDGTTTDLNTLIDPASGWTLAQATAINNDGDIVGYGTNAAGESHAFLLVPNSSYIPAPVISIQTTSLPDGNEGAPYDQFISATSSNPNDTLSWNITGLPSGLTYNSSTGEITGIPLATSTNVLDVTVIGENPSSTPATADISLTVDAPPTGTLVVEKDTIGGDGTFTFMGNNGIGSFSITTASGTGSDTFSNMVPGTYTITETNIPKGWTQATSSCSSVVVTAGGVDTCVVTNTMSAKLGEIRGTVYGIDDRAEIACASAQPIWRPGENAVEFPQSDVIDNFVEDGALAGVFRRVAFPSDLYDFQLLPFGKFQHLFDLAVDAQDLPFFRFCRFSCIQ